MLQWLAVLVLGHNVQADPGLLRGTGRGGENHGGASPSVAVVTNPAPRPAPAAGGDTTERSGLAPLWWLSFVSDADVFLGMAIVEATSEAAAVERATSLGINPGGEALAVDIPAERRAEHEPHRDRLIGADEARTLFEAKPLHEWEEAGEVTPAMLEHLEVAGQVVLYTQPPPEPDR